MRSSTINNGQEFSGEIGERKLEKVKYVPHLVGPFRTFVCMIAELIEQGLVCKTVEIMVGCVQTLI